MPTRAVAAAWYRLMGFTAEPIAEIPEHITSKAAAEGDAFRHLSFTFAVIALSARIACAGGKLTREKYIAFRDAFPLMGGICGKLRKLFVMACENTAPAEHYVTQIKCIFPRQQDLFTSLIDRLFRIAAAEGSIHKDAERMLARIAHLLDLSAAEYTEIRERYISAPKPHHILGVEKRISSARLKKHYYSLMKEYHPDRFANEKLSPEVDMLLRLKVSEINDAYRRLSKKAA